MSIIMKPLAALFISSIILVAPSLKKPTPSPTAQAKPAKIQAAILLDVSNSMDGLIDQAKSQLWNMVNVLGKASCNGVPPEVEIALYEYGRDDNDQAKGYVKMISAFTTDLDQLSSELFALTTNGGSEYCGHVLYSSLLDLNWDTAMANYKVIFIAGNEDFLQGDISYAKACAEARKKGVIINTIYCGDRQQGIKEHWKISDCGNGSFTNINQNAVDDIETPYDSTLMVLNDKLNGTYMAYGSLGYEGKTKQVQVDKMNAAKSEYVIVNRVTAKSKKGLYKNESWDLVDASVADSTVISKLDLNTLDDSLRTKSREEITRILATKKKEREDIQNRIGSLSREREKYIVAERRKKAEGSNQPTLETEMEKIIREQAKRFNMTID